MGSARGLAYVTVVATSGFTPATGPATAPGSGPPAPAQGPGGLFQAILAALQAAASPTPNANAPGAAPARIALETLIARHSGTTSAPVEGAAGPPIATETPRPEAELLLIDLVRQLTALQDALEDGVAPDPALESKAAETLEKLAALLTPSSEPAPTDIAPTIESSADWSALTQQILGPLVQPPPPSGVDDAPVALDDAEAVDPIDAAPAAPTGAPADAATPPPVAAPSGFAPAAEAAMLQASAPREKGPASGGPSSAAPTSPTADRPTAATATRTVTPPTAAVPDRDADREVAASPPRGQPAPPARQASPPGEDNQPSDSVRPNPTSGSAQPAPASSTAGIQPATVARTEGDVVPAPVATEPAVPVQSAEKAEARPLARLAPELARLADRVRELAAAFRNTSPELAQKLEAFAARLEAATPEDMEFARLTLPMVTDATDTELSRALERLLGDLPAPQNRRAAATAGTSQPAFADAEATDTADVPQLVLKPVPPSDRAEVKFEPAPPRSEAPPPAVARAEPQAPAPIRSEAAAPPPQPGGAMDAPDATPPQAIASTTGATSAQPTEARAVLQQAASAGAPPQINMPQLAVEIVRHVQAGNSQFQIRLDPPDLGRVDIKLDLDSNGNVHARMTVDKAETLDLMQRDQRVLERALAQAGLDSSKTSLEFSLRQNPFGRDGNQQQQNRPSAQLARGGTDDAHPTTLPVQSTAYRGVIRESGINLYV